MKVSAFTFVRNAVRLDYPVVESIASVLPIVDEFVVNVGDSSDETLDLIRSIESDKIRIMQSTWDPRLRRNGEVLAQQANLALSRCTGDWALYIQADEVLHEQDLPAIAEAMARHLGDPRVEGLLFNFVHFYANYHTCGVGRKWYAREIRVVRNGIGVKAWRDAQGFRLGGRKLRVAPARARMFHYGWVRPPARMKAKIVETARYWHDDETIRRRYLPGGEHFAYDTGGRLQRFDGTHPRVMAERIRRAQCEGQPQPAPARNLGVKDRALEWLERRLGREIGRYTNYTLLPEFKDMR